MYNYKKYATTLLLTGALFLCNCFLTALPALADTCFTQTPGGSTDISAGRLDSNQTATEFTPTENCNVTSISASVREWNNPTDNLVYAIYSDSGGTPGTLIESGTPSTPTSSYTTQTASITSVATLDTGTNYWLVLDRTGSYTNSNWYSILSGSSGDTPASWSSVSGTWFTNGGFPLNYEIDGSAGPAPTPAIPAQTFSTTTALTDNPTQDFDFGYLAFFSSMVFIIWLFKGRK